mmetsp:Transcript_12437/g.19707  ORF Transcript_12437/g.19707 Transcript_12437/m.19707 type:complete len:276 (-) Transcript_12437:207-1034(-)
MTMATMSMLRLTFSAEIVAAAFIVAGGNKDLVKAALRASMSFTREATATASSSFCASMLMSTCTASWGSARRNAVGSTSTNFTLSRIIFSRGICETAARFFNIFSSVAGIYSIFFIKKSNEKETRCESVTSISLATTSRGHIYKTSSHSSRPLASNAIGAYSNLVTTGFLRRLLRMARKSPSSANATLSFCARRMASRSELVIKRNLTNTPCSLAEMRSHSNNSSGNTSVSDDSDSTTIVAKRMRGPRMKPESSNGAISSSKSVCVRYTSQNAPV